MVPAIRSCPTSVVMALLVPRPRGSHILSIANLKATAIDSLDKILTQDQGELSHFQYSKYTIECSFCDETDYQHQSTPPNSKFVVHHCLPPPKSTSSQASIKSLWIELCSFSLTTPTPWLRIPENPHTPVPGNSCIIMHWGESHLNIHQPYSFHKLGSLSELSSKTNLAPHTSNLFFILVAVIGFWIYQYVQLACSRWHLNGSTAPLSGGWLCGCCRDWCDHRSR